MAYGRGNTLTESNEAEWWLEYAIWPGPYAVPTYIQHISTSPIETYYDVDKSHLAQLTFEYKKNLRPGDPLVIHGELIGWVISIEWHLTMTVMYQPYIEPNLGVR